MARKLFVNVESGDISKPFVFSDSVQDPVTLGQVPLGDVLDLEIVFVDRNGIAAWSGQAGYTIEAALGVVNAAPKSGTFTLKVGLQSTAALPYNATAAQVQAALEALVAIGAGNVTVSGPAGGPFHIAGAGELAEVNLTQITGDASALFPSASIVGVTGRDGDNGISEIQILSLACNPVSYTNVSTNDADAKSFALSLTTATAGMLELLSAGVKSVALTFALRVSGPAVVKRTLAQAPVTILASAINPGTIVTPAMSLGGYLLASDAADIYLTRAEAGELGGGGGPVAWDDIEEKPETFTPTAHKASHATGEADAIAPADIGAAPAVHGHDASEINSGVLDIARIPAAAVERLVIVADEAARFALTTEQVQKGDVVKQASDELVFYVVDDTQLDDAAGYAPMSVGSAASVPWSGVTDKPASFAPSAHTHPSSEISDSTPAGRALLTAPDVASQRAILGVEEGGGGGGGGEIEAPLLLPSGNQSAPTYSFADTPSAGMYADGNGVVLAHSGYRGFAFDGVHTTIGRGSQIVTRPGGWNYLADATAHAVLIASKSLALPVTQFTNSIVISRWAGDESPVYEYTGSYAASLSFGASSFSGGDESQRILFVKNSGLSALTIESGGGFDGPGSYAALVLLPGDAVLLHAWGDGAEAMVRNRILGLYRARATSLVATKTDTFTVPSSGADRADTFVCRSATPMTVTMPSAPGFAGRRVTVKNRGAGTVTITAFGLGGIDGSDTIDLATNEFVNLVSDGTEWLRI